MTGDKFLQQNKSHHVRMLTFLSCGWSPQRKQSPPLHPSQFSKSFLRSCDQLGEGWWKDRDLFLLRREDAKDISFADSRGDFSPPAPLNPPFRLTIWEYFSCCILSKALSTSSSVKSVKSSLLFRDCVERRVTLRKQLYLCNKVGLGNSWDFNVNCNFGLARSFKNKTDGKKKIYILCGSLWYVVCPFSASGTQTHPEGTQVGSGPRGMCVHYKTAALPACCRHQLRHSTALLHQTAGVTRGKRPRCEWGTHSSSCDIIFHVFKQERNNNPMDSFLAIERSTKTDQQIFLCLEMFVLLQKGECTYSIKYPKDGSFNVLENAAEANHWINCNLNISFEMSCQFNYNLHQTWLRFTCSVM